MHQNCSRKQLTSQDQSDFASKLTAVQRAMYCTMKKLAAIVSKSDWLVIFEIGHEV